MTDVCCNDMDIIFNGVVVAKFVEPGADVSYSEIEEFKSLLRYWILEEDAPPGCL